MACGLLRYEALENGASRQSRALAREPIKCQDGIN
jgi:hypothetical protein